jgi:dienelactone hydrolase
LTGEPLAKAQAAWPADIDIALEYLVSQPGASRDVVGVGGASCGVNLAVQTARRDPRVKSLVLLAGTTDREGRAFLRTGRRVPALFAFADDDEFPASILTTQWLYALAATPQKDLLRYPKGGHGAEMFPVQPCWQLSTNPAGRRELPRSSRAARRPARPVHFPKRW